MKKALILVSILATITHITKASQNTSKIMFQQEEKTAMLKTELRSSGTNSTTLSSDDAERDDLTTTECITNLVLCGLFIILGILFTIRQTYNCYKLKDVLTRLHYTIIILIFLAILTRSIYLFDGISYFIYGNEHDHIIPLDIYLSLTTFDVFCITEVALLFSLLWIEIAVYLLEEKKNYEKLAIFIKISIVVNPIFVVLETIAVKLSSIFIFPILIAMVTLIVTCIVFVSGYAFTRGLGKAYNGDYIRNVKNIFDFF